MLIIWSYLTNVRYTTEGANLLVLARVGLIKLNDIQHQRRIDMLFLVHVCDSLFIFILKTIVTYLQINLKFDF